MNIEINQEISLLIQDEVINFVCRTKHTNENSNILDTTYMLYNEDDPNKDFILSICERTLKNVEDKEDERL